MEAWRGSPSRDRARVEEPPDLGVRLRQLLEAGFLLEGLFQGDVQGVGDHLGDPVHLAVGHIQGPAHIPDDRPGLHLPEGDDLGDMVLPVLLANVPDDLFPPVNAEIDVDIRAG